MGVCYGTPDFPTPSFTGYLKSGMKLTISSSSSSAASGNQAIGDGEILADSKLIIFSLAELKAATNSFHGDALLGEGGFGSVYKGMLHGKQNSQRTKTIIAVKKLNPCSVQGFYEWQNEIEFLGNLSHPNLAKLLGYSREDNELAIVYEFAPKGSLNNHLFRKGSTAHLPWNVRLKIVIGAARGLAFLHSSRNIIYRDFKTSNILLDGSFTAKLTDFGLARLGPPEGMSHLTTRVMGTYGYAAPEYVLTGHLYIKSDVYSFGVVLLEILTGLTVFDRSRPTGRQNLVEWVKPLLSKKRKLITVMDSRLKGNYSINSALQIAKLALRCLPSDPNKRPSMTEVLKALESIEAASADRVPGDA